MHLNELDTVLLMTDTKFIIVGIKYLNNIL